MMAWRRCPIERRHHPQHLDTPRQITDTAGNVVWQRDNTDPFGNNPPNENPSGLGTYNFNLGFSGQYWDRETNTYQNYFRDCYDPATGRYCQPDPIGLLGGNNIYTYALSNPLRFVDPTGLDVFIVIHRTTFTSSSIIGTVNVVSTNSGESFSGNTLENASPPNSNLPVPPGTYTAFVRTSDNYPVDRIQLNRIPFASGVQIHNGNTARDVVGCFAVGNSASKNRVSDSIDAMDKINDVISSDDSGKITVIVIGNTKAK